MKEKVILFGASEGGRFFFSKYRDTFEIIAFVDNDAHKQGTPFCGLPVCRPAGIMEMGCDAVIVCSIFVHQIRQQLVEELGIPIEMIRFCPKEVIEGKDIRPFEDEPTRELAGEMILFIQKTFWEYGVMCLLDHGTLLGIVREGDVLAWDDDVDLSVLATQKDEAIACLRKAFSLLPRQAECRWNLILGVQERKGEPAPWPVFLSLQPSQNTKYRYFSIEISLTHMINDLAVQMLNQAPAKYFRGVEWIDYKGAKVAVPFDYQAYLTIHYGDWRVPRNKMSFYDIHNFCEPVAPTKRFRLIGGGKDFVKKQ